MNKYLLGGVAAAAILGRSAAIAQTAPPAKPTPARAVAKTQTRADVPGACRAHVRAARRQQGRLHHQGGSRRRRRHQFVKRAPRQRMADRGKDGKIAHSTALDANKDGQVSRQEFERGPRGA